MYGNNQSGTTKYLLFSKFSFHYGIFRPSWPSSGNIKYMQDTWEDVSNTNFYKKKLDLIFA